MNEQKKRAPLQQPSRLSLKTYTTVNKFAQSIISNKHNLVGPQSSRVQEGQKRIRVEPDVDNGDSSLPLKARAEDSFSSSYSIRTAQNMAANQFSPKIESEMTDRDCLVGDDQPVYNPLSFLPFLERADQDLKIQNQVVTPVDKSTVVQVLSHPKREKMFITVHKVTKNVLPPERPSSRFFGSQVEKLQCPQHKAELEMSLSSNEKCKGCENQTSEPPYYSCPNCIQPDVYCNLCVCKQYQRFQMQQKSYNHQFYECYKFEGEKYNQHKNRSDFDDFVDEQKGYGTNQYEFTRWPAELNIDEMTNQLTDFVTIAIWIESKGYFNLSWQHHIDYAVIFDRPKSPLNLKNVVFLSEDMKSLFYFQKYHDEQVKMQEIFLGHTFPEIGESYYLQGDARDCFENYHRNQEFHLQEPRLLKNMLCLANLHPAEETKKEADKDQSSETDSSQCFSDESDCLEEKTFEQTFSLHFFEVQLKQPISKRKYDLQKARLLLKNTDIEASRTHHIFKFETITIDTLNKLQKKDKMKSHCLLNSRLSVKSQTFLQQKSTSPSKRLNHQDTLPNQSRRRSTCEADDKNRFAGTDLSVLDVDDIVSLSVAEYDAETGEELLTYTFRIFLFEKNFQLEGYMHSHSSRCTFLVEGIDCRTLLLNKAAKTHRNLFQLKYNSMDSQIIYDPSDRHSQLKFVGFLEKSNENGFNNEYKMTIINLDQEQQAPEMGEEEELIAKKKFLYFSCSEQLSQELLRWEIMPFKSMAEPTHRSTLQHFRTQICYLDLKSGCTEISFINARTELEVNVRLPECKVLSTGSKQIVEYPILCYLSTDLERNSLMIANLQKNIKQTKLVLDYKIICFTRHETEVRIVDRRTEPVVIIELIAMSTKERAEGCIRQLRLIIQPFRELDRDYCSLALINSHQLDFSMYNFNQIQTSCQLKVQDTLTNRVNEILILQVPNNILVFENDNPGQALFGEQTALTEIRMAPINMLQQADSVLFIQESKGKYEIMEINQDSVTSQINMQSIYSVKVKILAFQFSFNDETSKESQVQFLILDNSYKIRLLRYEETSELLTKLVEVRRIELRQDELKNIMKGMEQIPWSTCLISVQTIISCLQWQTDESFQQNEENSRWSITRDITIYSNESKTKFRREFLEFPKPFEEISERNSLSIMQVPNIGRYMILYQENDFCYYLTTMRPGLRRVDLVKQSMLDSLTIKNKYEKYEAVPIQFNIVGKNPVISFLNKVLVFDEKTLMLSQLLQGTITETHKDMKTSDLLLVLKSGSDLNVTKINNDTTEVIFKKTQLQRKDYRPNLIINELNKLRMQGNQKIESQSHHAYAQVKTIIHNLNVIVFRMLFNQEQSLKFAQLQGSSMGSMRESAIRQLGRRMSRSLFESKSLRRSQSQTSIAAAAAAGQRKTIFIMRTATSVSAPWGVSELKTPGQPQQGGPACEIIYFMFEEAMPINQDQINLVYTDNYLVIGHFYEIYFVELSKLPVHKLESCSLSDLSQFYVPVQIICLLDMLQEKETLKCGYHITNTRECDLRQIYFDAEDSSKQLNPADFIQISFEDTAMIWDLRKNAELLQLDKISDFFGIQNFILTGFSYFICQRKPTEQNSLQKQWDYYQSNSDNTLHLIPGTDQHNPALFRSYSQWDVNHMRIILRKVKNYSEDSLSSKQISSKLLTANIRGQTYFSLFKETTSLLMLAESYLRKKLNQENEKHVLRLVVKNLDIPFFHYVQRTLEHCKQKTNEDDCLNQESSPQKFPISFKTSCERETKFEENNILMYFIKSQQIQHFETLMQIKLSYPQEINATHSMHTFNDFKTLFETQNDLIDRYMQSMHIVTPVSEGLRYLNWPTGKKNIIIPAKTSLHSLRWVREKAEEILSKKTGVGGVNDRTQKDVSLKIIKVGWLNNEVRQFFQYLAKSEKPSIYDNELIKTLLDQQDYTQKIMLVTILPYIVYLLSLFLYFHTYLARDVEDDQDFWDSDLLATCLRSLIYILSGYLMVLEYYQMKLQKVRYWLQWWNYMQLSMFILNIALVLAHTWNLTQISRMHMVNLATLSLFMTWITFFYWWRLFPTFAFYVSLVVETIIDLTQFLYFYIMIIIGFGTIMMIINSSIQSEKLGDKEDDTFIKYRTDNDFFNATLVMWLMGLADFNLDNFGEKNLALVMFVLSSFILNILYLNLLINVMGDTLERMKEQRARTGLIERTQLYADFIHMVDPEPMLNKESYIYIISPSSNMMDLNQNEGDYGVKKISNSMLKLEYQQKTYQNKLNMRLQNVESNQAEYFENINQKLRSQSFAKQQRADYKEAVRNTLTKSLDRKITNLTKRVPSSPAFEESNSCDSSESLTSDSQEVRQPESPKPQIDIPVVPELPQLPEPSHPAESSRRIDTSDRIERFMALMNQKMGQLNANADLIRQQNDELGSKMNKMEQEINIIRQQYSSIGTLRNTIVQGKEFEVEDL